MPSTTVVDDAWVFPEDSGTNTNVDLSSGDWADSGNFASVFYAVGVRDFVVEGLGLTADYSAQELSVSPGAAVLTRPSVGTVDHTGDGGRAAETRDHGASFLIHVTADQPGLPLNSSGVHHVFLTAELTSDDAASIHIDQDQTPPATTSLKIGEVDMDAETTAEVNREPQLTAAAPQTDQHATTKKYVDEAVAGAQTTYGATETRSGDNTTRTFSFSHDLGVEPQAVSITPATEDAVGQFFVSSKDAATIEITFAEERPAGTNNLQFEVLAVR